jgi:anti-sigma regulatory factor (Ser/Thr protein kinase)
MTTTPGDSIGDKSPVMDVRLSLTANASAPSHARRAVDELESDLGERVAEDIRLLVSELVTNSIRHSGTPRNRPIEFALSASPEVIRIEVLDRGSWRPPSPDPGGTSGWGLFLVDRLSDRWGVEHDQGTRAWFEIDRSRSPNGSYVTAA